jgi:hypothetical protein
MSLGEHKHSNHGKYQVKVCGLAKEIIYATWEASKGFMGQVPAENQAQKNQQTSAKREEGPSGKRMQNGEPWLEEWPVVWGLWSCSAQVLWTWTSPGDFCSILDQYMDQECPR